MLSREIKAVSQSSTFSPSLCHYRQLELGVMLLVARIVLELVGWWAGGSSGPCTSLSHSAWPTTYRLGKILLRTAGKAG